MAARTNANRIKLVKIGEVGMPTVSMDLKEDVDVEALEFLRTCPVKFIFGDENLPEDKLDNFHKSLRCLRNYNGSVRYYLGRQVEPFGRMNSSGLQATPRMARALLCGGAYVELDFVNCQPTIALHLAESKGWKCDALRQYVANRDEVLQQLTTASGMTRDDAKDAVNAAMFGAAEETLRKKGVPEGSFILAQLVPELAAMRTAIVEDEEYAKLHSKMHSYLAAKGKPEWKLRSSMAAFVLQTYERFALEALVKELKNHGREAMTYIHDGVLVRGADAPLPEDILHACEARVLADTGIPLKLASKRVEATAALVEAFEASRGPARKKARAMSDSESSSDSGSSSDHDSDRSSSSGSSSSSSVASAVGVLRKLARRKRGIAPSGKDVVIRSDSDAAEVFVACLGDGIVLDGGVVYVYDSNNGLWTDNRGVLDRLVYAHKDELNGGPKANYGSMRGKRENMVQMLPAVMTPSDGYMRGRFGSDAFKLLFTDGVYNFASGRVDSFSPSIVFTCRVPRAVPKSEASVDAGYAYVRDNLFVAPFRDGDVNSGELPPMGRRLLHRLMRAVVGDVHEKALAILVGPTNCGKGSLMDLCGALLGKEAVVQFSGNNLLLKRTDGEDAYALKWTAPFLGARMAVSSKINVSSATGSSKIDGALLCRLSSGGSDEIVYRPPYGQEVKAVNKAALFIMCNAVPTIEPFESQQRERLRNGVIIYDYSFVASVKNAAVEKLAIPDFKMVLVQELQVAGFWRLIKEEYTRWQSGDEPPQDDAYELARDEALGVPDVRGWLEERYIITGDAKDYVATRELQSYLRSMEELKEETDNSLGRKLTAAGVLAPMTAPNKVAGQKVRRGICPKAAASAVAAGMVVLDEEQF